MGVKMVQGFERAQAEYESRMNDPYGYDEELYDEDEYESNAYWSHVDKQMEDYKLGDL